MFVHVFKVANAALPAIKLVVCISLLNLAACAPATPFQNSTSSNAVKVEIRSDQMQARSWTLYTFQNGDLCQGRSVAASSATVKSVDLRVEPGKRHTYALYLLDGNSTCGIATSFTATAGNIYSVRISSDRQRCYMATLNTTKTIDGIREPSATKRISKTAFVESGEWCAPLNPADIGKPIESMATSDPNNSNLPKAPDGSRQGTSLDDLKDLLPKAK